MADSTQPSSSSAAPAPRVGEHAIVIGASVAGLLAARVLSDSYDRVTVLDRDTLPAALDAPRRAVPQGYHAHGLQLGGQVAIEELLPGYSDEVIANGSASLRPGLDMRFNIGGHDLPRVKVEMEATVVQPPDDRGRHPRSRRARSRTSRSATRSASPGSSRTAAASPASARSTARPAASRRRCARTSSSPRPAAAARCPPGSESMGYDKPAEERIGVDIIVREPPPADAPRRARRATDSSSTAATPRPRPRRRRARRGGRPLERHAPRLRRRAPPADRRRGLRRVPATVAEPDVRRPRSRRPSPLGAISTHALPRRASAAATTAQALPRGPARHGRRDVQLQPDLRPGHDGRRARGRRAAALPAGGRPPLAKRFFKAARGPVEHAWKLVERRGPRDARGRRRRAAARPPRRPLPRPLHRGRGARRRADADLHRGHGHDSPPSPGCAAPLADAARAPPVKPRRRPPLPRRRPRRGSDRRRRRGRPRRDAADARRTRRVQPSRHAPGRLRGAARRRRRRARRPPTSTALGICASTTIADDRRDRRQQRDHQRVGRARQARHRELVGDVRDHRRRDADADARRAARPGRASAGSGLPAADRRDDDGGDSIAAARPSIPLDAPGAWRRGRRARCRARTAAALANANAMPSGSPASWTSVSR